MSSCWIRQLRRISLVAASASALLAGPVHAGHKGSCCPAPCATAEQAPATQAPSDIPSLTDSAPMTASPLDVGSSLAMGGDAFMAMSPGYIDSAIPRTQFRIRGDAGYDVNRKDRAEFFYGKCGCFRVVGIDPSAPGPPLVESSVDYQEIQSYLEIARGRASAFVEIPVRFINPVFNENEAGLGDVNAGFKYAFVANEEQYLTFQLRGYFPTGDAFKGLGTDHYSVEPALLLRQRLSDRLALDGELRDWIGIEGTNFTGNVLRYGLGLSYLAINRCNFRVVPIGEIVGWTVLDGQEFFPVDEAAAFAANFQGDTSGLRVEDAVGDTIVNAKIGVRFGFGSVDNDNLLSRSDLYIGYGRALTGEVWYKDMYRIEYRVSF